MKNMKPLEKIYFWIILIFMYLPIVTLIVPSALFETDSEIFETLLSSGPTSLFPSMKLARRSAS